MASSVVVQAPNGRRQTIKVTPNTTILQIIEEACKKQGLKPELYNVKHYRNIVDTTSTLRFSGLPNNCLLELVEAQVARTESQVTVGVQLEDGQRLMDLFLPTNTVWDVLKKLCPAELQENTVIVYMRNEIYGNDLKKTSLKSLGITNGRAMLRILHRSPEDLKTQANVSIPLPLKPAEERPYKRQFQKLENFEEFKPPANETQKMEAETSKAAKTSVKIDETESEDDSKVANNHYRPVKKQNLNLFDQLKMEKQKQTSGLKVKSKQQKEEQHKSQFLEDEFVFLGERNAMLFSLETAQQVRSEDLPDDFFELSIKDVKKIFRDIKKRRAECEQGGPLMTAAMRKLEESKKQLRTLSHYRKAVIRIEFPKRLVLQGIFGPNECVLEVYKFVREYLDDKALDFYLFTTPPKSILSKELTLLEADCVPGVLLHFGCEEKRENYLRHDILYQVSDTSTATIAASKIRLANTRNIPQPEEDMELDSDLSDISVIPSTSANEPIPSYDHFPKQPITTTSERAVPKWFKPSK